MPKIQGEFQRVLALDGQLVQTMVLAAERSAVIVLDGSVDVFTPGTPSLGGGYDFSTPNNGAYLGTI